MDPLLDLVHFRNCGWAYCSWPEQKKMMWICQKSDFTALSTVFFKAAANKTHGRFWKDIPPTNTHQYFFLYQKHLQPKAKKPIWRTLFFPIVSFLFCSGIILTIQSVRSLYEKRRRICYCDTRFHGPNVWDICFSVFLAII